MIGIRNCESVKKEQERNGGNREFLKIQRKSAVLLGSNILQKSLRLRHRKSRASREAAACECRIHRLSKYWSQGRIAAIAAP